MGLFGRGSKEGKISFDEFTSAIKNNGYPEPSHATYWSFLNEARNVSLFDKQELAMVLAHFIHESDGFIEKREKVSMEKYPAEYKDPSCDFPKQLYYGRGFLKIAECKNYKAASKDIFKDERLVETPDLVATDEDVAMQVGFSVWKRNVHGIAGVKQGHFGETTNALNGKVECSGSDHLTARRRFEIYRKVRKAFHLKKASPEAEMGCYDLKEFIKVSKNSSKQ